MFCNFSSIDLLWAVFLSACFTVAAYEINGEHSSHLQEHRSVAIVNENGQAFKFHRYMKQKVNNKGQVFNYLKQEAKQIEVGPECYKDGCPEGTFLDVCDPYILWDSDPRETVWEDAISWENAKKKNVGRCQCLTKDECILDNWLTGNQNFQGKLVVESISDVPICLRKEEEICGSTDFSTLTITKELDMETGDEYWQCKCGKNHGGGLKLLNYNGQGRTNEGIASGGGKSFVCSKKVEIENAILEYYNSCGWKYQSITVEACGEFLRLDSNCEEGCTENLNKKRVECTSLNCCTDNINFDGNRDGVCGAGDDPYTRIIVSGECRFCRGADGELGRRYLSTKSRQLVTCSEDDNSELFSILEEKQLLI